MHWLSTVVAMLSLGASLTAAPTYAQTCEQLWVERNQYYKNHGYCFKTERGIEYFGNGGCHINDQNAVPLSQAERARIAQIVQEERAMGCNIEGGGTVGMTCNQLWIARNSIYKARGYCFKTQRGIEYFGNGGCIYQNENDVPFTQAERTLIAQYVAQERAQGC
jgi:hypothetical protein